MVSTKPIPLSAKDNALFKSVVKFYTTKQYKKGLKAADAILKSNPNHGETLAMKGLILNCQEKKTEAYDYVRRGLKADLTSHVCWHTYGLLYRSDRNYTEAIKCYLNALRHDKDNLQILRDLSLLQIQMRDLQGYYETRRKLLTLKPQQGNNWLAFAMSAHLLRYYEEAAMILDMYDKTKKIEVGFEYSEMLLYRNMILEESGKYPAALDHLNAIEHNVVDKLAWKEKRAQLLNLDGHFEDSELVYRNLIHSNPENQNYHCGIIAAKLSAPIAGHYAQLCRNITEGQESTLEALYQELAKDHPRSLFVRRVPLEFLHGAKFYVAFAKYLCPNLRKGVPSLFTGIKALYNDQQKKVTITEFLNEAVESLSISNTFPVGIDGSKDTPADIEPPSSLLWTLYFAAQHYDKLNDHKKAIELIDKAIEHTPTVIELYTLKAKVLKHAGDPVTAWSVYEKGRELDLADRYLNTKATLYALRASKVDTAERTIALFTKEGTDSQDVLYDMQCMWYEIESAGAYLRTEQYGQGLKKLVAVDKHFADIVEDQFDFHTYCLRKMTLRAYVSLLRLEDKLYGLQFYVAAAKALVNTYLSIFEHPPSSTKEDGTQGMSSKERKKVKQATKKEAKPSIAATKASAKTTSEDPYGDKLVSVANPLDEAYKYLTTLLKYSPDDVIRALHKAAKLAPEHPELHQYIVELGLAAPGLSGNSIVASLVQEHTSQLLGGKSPVQVNDEFIAELCSSPFSHRVVAAKLLLTLTPHKQTEAFSIFEDDSAFAKAQLKDVLAAYKFVSSIFNSEQVEKFRVKGHSYFPFAIIFIPITTNPINTTTQDIETK